MKGIENDTQTKGETMGLDMYLNIHRYIDMDKENKSGSITSRHTVDGVATHITTDASEISYLVLGGLYWRKANQIHKWFIDNCCDGIDDCRDHWVHSSKLTELLDLCKQVRDDHSLAEKLLPTVSGFFFGSTDYDEWYYEDITGTITMLEEFIPKILSCDELYYRPSW